MLQFQPRDFQNEFLSAKLITNEHNAEHEEDLADLKYDKLEPDTLICIFASRAIDILSNIDQHFNYHIDSTYKLILRNLPYYVVSTKFKESHSIPLFHFVIKPDSAENIKFCLQKYFEWTTKKPKYFVSDCTLQIFNGIFQLFRNNPEVNVFWCALHVMRAFNGNKEKFNGDDELFKRIQKKMNYLCYARCLDSEQSQKIVERIKELIEPNKELTEYFNNQWWKYGERWIVSNKPKEVPLTNNVSESLFKKLKYYDFGGSLHMKFDYFVFFIMNDISKSYASLLNADLLLKAKIKLPVTFEIITRPRGFSKKFEAKDKLKELGKLISTGNVNLNQFI